MLLDDVIEIKKADPDSQWRLRPCKKCGSENVAYEHYNGERTERVAAVKISQANSEQEILGTATGQGAAWRVKCFDCGHTVDKGCTVRHDAQGNWNGG